MIFVVLLIYNWVLLNFVKGEGSWMIEVDG